MKDVWIKLTLDEAQMAYGALNELKYRAEEEPDSAPLTDEEEELRERLENDLETYRGNPRDAFGARTHDRPMG